VLQKIDRDFKFLETALKTRAFRQELLGSNLANADTPNYKAVDIDFKTALTNAMAQHGGQNGQALPMARTDGGHRGSASGDSAPARVQFRGELQSSIDGNSVDADQEMARFSENAMHYQALLTFATNRIRTLQQALSANS